MNDKKNRKLELVWPGKEDWAKPEPRLVLEQKRFGTKSGADDNLLIHGDNLLGLKALERNYTGKVKCICIDPPYNSKSAFQTYVNSKDSVYCNYNDNMEHSKWLNLMKERLILLHRLLRADGSIWIVIDDDECHYLKVICDEIFGRNNFISCVVWNHSIQVKGYKNIFSRSHNYILAYRKSNQFCLKSAPRNENDNRQYTNPDNDPKGPWCRGPVANSLYRPNLVYNVRTPNGKIISPPQKGWRWSRETLANKINSGEVCFNKSETSMFRKIYLSEQDGKSPNTIWNADDAGTTREANKEIRELITNEIFPTPKPERLIKRILELATEPGDLVLDSFAGSGTTGAVAHKMKRRWIMIELNGPCKTHIIPRLQKVIEGTDQGGISQAVNWKGGGGFRFCDLAPSLLEKNRLNRWVISKKYNQVMLAEDLCRKAGYTFNPHQDPWWLHGYSTENDFIHVTPSSLDKQQLKRLSRSLGHGQSLLVYCGAFMANANEFENLTLKKIPKSLLKDYEWGRDDYSLRNALQQEATKANRKKSKMVSAASGERVQVSLAAGAHP
jgi:adenine-specific DNA-methyltransferase